MGLFRWLRRSPGDEPSPEPASSARAPEAVGDADREALFRDAVGRHYNGDFDGAEQIYRRILEMDSGFVPALHLLGRIHAQRGKLSEAQSLLEKARSLSPEDADVLADLASFHRLGGRADDARRLLETAVGIEPERADFHYALAGLDLAAGNFEVAIPRLERTIALDDTHADALNDLGAAYLQAGRYEDAANSLQRAVGAAQPSAAAFRNLAILYSRVGNHTRSIEYFRQALQKSPGDHELRMRLAEELFLSGDAAAALKEFQAVAEHEPGNALVWLRLAETATKVDRCADAIAWYRRALEIEPRQPTVLNNLGILLDDAGCYEQAAAVFEQAQRIQPDFAMVCHNLAGTYHVQNRHEEAVDAYRKALALDPRNLITLSNLIAITNYRSQRSDGLAEELVDCYLRSVAPERVRALVAPAHDRSPERPLRVGYVSPDFRLHSVAFFIEPLIEAHDRQRFEVYCYADVAKPDAVTERFKTLADHWLDTSEDSDEALAERIRRDRIDLLVDLNGHFAGNRLPVFAQKPAPVQITYLGYPATTALPEMDYRLTDAVADPPGKTEALHAETLLRLPGPFLCYRPPDDAPAIASKDVKTDAITFCSFNELSKVSPEVIRCWCRILQQAPDASLLLKATALADGDTCVRVRKHFEAAGIASDRIQLRGRTASLREHLATYSRVTVALDTFPYNGTTTTCEAIYMGVPVVTLAGEAHAGRVGASLLGALELSELVAHSTEEYVAKALALAADRKRQVMDAETLRQRLLESPLCDARSFVASMEKTYLDIWNHHHSEERERDGTASLLDVTGSMCVGIREDLRVILPDDLNELTAYVLLEQEDWFEDETTFVETVLAPGMRVLDVGANYGIYTLLAARRVGNAGRVFSVEPSSTTVKWLRASLAVNALENVEIFQHALSDRSGNLRLSTQEGSEYGRLLDDDPHLQRGELVKVLRLDEFANQAELESIDFVKLDAEGAEKQIIDGGRRFFDQQSPLVMFEIKSAQSIDFALVRKFSDLGYQPLRLVPGLELLAPVDLSEPLDPYSLNLFACKSDRRRTLEQCGLVAEGDVDQATARKASEDRVWEYLRSRNYSRHRVDGWKARIGSKRSASDTGWMRMLGYFVAAADTDSAPASRLASLQAAFELAAAAGSEIGPGARLNSQARIAWALGYRSKATEALGALVDLDGQAEGAFDWPFLPASPLFDSLDPVDRLAAWCEACARDQYQCLRGFSSYFLAKENLQSLEQLKGNPFQRPEMERRRLLVRLRHGMQLGDASPVVRLTSPENRNPDYWSRKLEVE